MNLCHIKYDWFDIFQEPIKFRVTSPFDVIMRKSVKYCIYIYFESIDSSSAAIYNSRNIQYLIV